MGRHARQTCGCGPVQDGGNRMADQRFTQEGIREGKSWWVRETPHYVILFDEVARELLAPERFAVQAETRLRQIAAVLGLRKHRTTKRYPTGDRIAYFVHDRSVCTHGNVSTGGIDVPATGRAWFYRHEEAHAVLNRVIPGFPPLFNEGFATFVEQPGSTRNHRIALAASKADALPALTSLASPKEFWTQYNTFGYLLYGQAGSFVEYLFRRHGKRMFFRLGNKLAPGTSGKTVLRAFGEAYGHGLDCAEEQWRAYLYRRQQHLPLLTRVVRGSISDARWVREAVREVKARTRARSAVQEPRG